MSRTRRRRSPALVSLAALALFVGAFVIARPDGSIEPARTPAGTRMPAPLSRPSPPPQSSTARRQDLGRPGLAAARTAVRDFLADYLRSLRHRRSARPLSHAAPELQRDLRRHAPRARPAQQVRPPTVRAVDIAPQPIASVRAIATLQDRGGPPYPLLLYRERRGARWLVTRIGDA